MYSNIILYSGILFWVFIGIFILTALITLLGIINLLKIKEGYLKPLFFTLIVEVVGAIVMSYRIYVNNPSSQSCEDFSGNWQLQNDPQIQNFTQSGCELAGSIQGDPGHIYKLNIVGNLAIGYAIRTVQNCTTVMSVSIARKDINWLEETSQGFSCGLESVPNGAKNYYKLK